MKLGFIGCGNMAKAMINGIVKNDIAAADEMIASDAIAVSLLQVREEFGINGADDNKEVAEKAEIIILAVKPQYYEEVMEDIAPVVKKDKLIITIAPGITIARVEAALGSFVKIVRTMPNTPAHVGAGVTGICSNQNVTTEELVRVQEILSGIGTSEIVPESLMNAVVAVSGSSPAYVYMFIEALADGAVAEGMPRAQAYKFAAQTVLGSAKMVLETGKHPGELKDMVCSPAGTTIEAVKALEMNGFRGAVLSGMEACIDRANEL